ncbi:hypothetical protein SAMN05421663_109146 [Terribacillus halophilus]|uniref:HD domain-containing protein n=1 Tax=Terribacillus halophilus TaxID=361279 RepID=A0A1G6U4V6_9BACI|nr:HD domain-containing protein [Terribacillus halophilus]SDD35575.1 hypothetical protein SAMN05421663_109146 [Terribacillus halophilus]
MKRDTLIQEPLYPPIKPHQWEGELFQSTSVRRLKHLAHFGAGSLVTSVVHSRFEHTVGVWKLAAHFFPDDDLLRAAAILHDIGHLPFSHAVEEALEYDHHQITEQYILGEDITKILGNASIESADVVEYLRNPSVLTGRNHVLGIDHLDSFFRDTYMFCNTEVPPHHILPKLTCTEQGIDTDLETGLYLLKLIKQDHELFLSPFLVGADRLLAEAIKSHWNEQSGDADRQVFAKLTDMDVVAMLQSSSSFHAKRIIRTLLYESDKINISEPRGYPIHIRKIYAKAPQCNGQRLTEISKEAHELIDGLSDLTFNRHVSIDTQAV